MIQAQLPDNLDVSVLHVFDEIKTKCHENKNKLGTLNERLAKLETDVSSSPNITPEKVTECLEDTVLDINSPKKINRKQ